MTVPSPIILTFGPDCYEILLTADCAVAHIIRYRHMRLGAGEFVDYDDLSQSLQQIITNHLLRLIDPR